MNKKQENERISMEENSTDNNQKEGQNSVGSEGNNSPLQLFRNDLKTKISISVAQIIILSLIALTCVVTYAIFREDLGKSVMVLFLVLMFLAAYRISRITSKLHRYNNALQKLDILILRLRLNTNKDLEISSRLDRELEMIYRILES